MLQQRLTPTRQAAAHVFQHSSPWWKTKQTACASAAECAVNAAQQPQVLMHPRHSPSQESGRQAKSSQHASMVSHILIRNTVQRTSRGGILEARQKHDVSVVVVEPHGVRS